MKAIFYSIILLLIPASAFSQTVSYSMGVISFTLTSCNKNRALSSIDFFMESKPFYHFDIYPVDYNNFLSDARILSGNMSDLKTIYNGFSYGSYS
jgi:hypothetical protein